MRSVVLATGVSLCLMGSCLAQGVSTATLRVQTRIRPQRLASALKQFAKLENIHVLYLTADVRDLHTPGASGNLTPNETLTRLLTGTGLDFRYVDSNVVSIIPERPAGAAQTTGSDAAKATQRTALGGANRDPPQTAHDSTATEARQQGHARGTNAQALHEVIVTAQKYKQRAFDVPISLTVVSGTELLAHGITNLSTLQYDVPGLYMNSSGYSQAVYIRGVANDSGNGAVVGQYVDEADITAEDTSGQAGLATGDVGLYDLSRVEVLKGPQGTLYGDGSLGGVIRYITNKPDLYGVRMSADVADIITQYGAPSERIQTMLNTPVVDGTFGLRFAGSFEHDGGWVDEPAAEAKNVNGSNLADVRVEALWCPVSRLNITATQIVHRHAAGLGMGEDSQGNITPLFGTTLIPNQEDNSNLSNITVTYDVDAVRVLSSSTYLSETQNIYDMMVATPLGSEVFWTMYPVYHSQNRDTSEEFRLSNSGTGPWQWIVGGFYKHFRDQIFYSDYAGFSGSTLSSAVFSPPSPFGDTSTSKAVFANTSYRFLGHFTAGAGLRYDTDRETTFPPVEAATFRSTDPRIFLQYQGTRRVNVYASASKGFRSGGFNAPSEPTYQPETLWSYDLGTKVAIPERGLNFDVDLFYMSYSNYVNLTYIPPQYENANIGKARIRGVDADLTWRPVHSWQLGLSAEILNTQFLTASEISGYVAGNRLPFAPTYSFTGSVVREFRLRGKGGSASLYYYEISRVQDRTFGSPVEQSDIQHFLDTRVAMYLNDNLQIGVFARNLLNDRGSESPWASFNESVRPRPRSLGFEFSVHFE